jgi:predicted amidophosphoribosyltransferase
MVPDGDDFVCSCYPFCTGRIFTLIKNTCGHCGKPFTRKLKQNETHCKECTDKLREEYGWKLERKKMPIAGECKKCGKDVKQFHDGMCKMCYVRSKKEKKEKRVYSMTGIKSR